MRIERWHLGLIALCAAACQVLSGLDDLEAVPKAKMDTVTSADAGDAGSGAGAGRDAGDDNDSGADTVTRSEAGSGGGGAGGAGGAAGASGEGVSSGSAGGEPTPCRPPVSGGVACDPVAQCGCGSSENCVFYAGKLACVAQGDAQPYHACSADRDCMQGYQCVGGVCGQSCRDASDKSCSGDAARCAQIAFNGTPVSGNYVCTRSCNPAHPQRDDDNFEACGPGLGCTTFGDHSDCIVSTATGVAGVTCKRDGDCAPGFYCSVSMVCEKWCEVRGSDCGSGASCEGFVNKEFAGKSEFGVCCAPPAGKGACDTSPQCGCGNDQRCDFVLANGKADGSTACVSIGSVAAYGPCTAQSSCGRGYSCTDRACRMLCDLTRPNACVSYSEFSRCLPVQVNGIDVPGWGVCSQVCNPAAPFKEDSRFTACVNGTSCRHLGDGETNCLPIADPAAAVGKTGDPCDSGTGTPDGGRCAPGYFCDIGSLTCMQYCDVAAANACANGATCAPFVPAVQVATISLGYCQ